MAVRIVAKRVQIQTGAWVGLFRCEVDGDVDFGQVEQVSLARVPDHCYYAVNELHLHDYHAPAYPTKEALDTYIKRVFKDIKKVLKDAGIEMGKSSKVDAEAISLGPNIANVCYPPGSTLSDN